MLLSNGKSQLCSRAGEGVWKSRLQGVVAEVMID
jgi:hypothetical protein